NSFIVDSPFCHRPAIRVGTAAERFAPASGQHLQRETATYIPTVGLYMREGSQSSCYGHGVATQAERSQATRARLLAVAREILVTKGYSRMAIEDVTRIAGLTKGAFYHHFADKQAIFRAVFEETEHELLEAAAAGAKGADAWKRFRAGCRAFLKCSLDPG